MQSCIVFLRPLGLDLPTALAGCGAGERPAPQIKVEYRDVYRETQKPCPVKRPALPKPLARPFPTDPARLVDLLTAKLTEWAGAGGYGERADGAILRCISDKP